MSNILQELQRRRDWHFTEFGKGPSCYVLTDEEPQAFDLATAEVSKYMNINPMKFRAFCGVKIFSQSALADYIAGLDLRNREQS
jgi:hypothetical protein